MTANGDITDKEGKKALLYPDVIDSLNLIKQHEVPMAVASRITDVSSAYQLIFLSKLDRFFDHLEVYPTRKTLHFKRLQEKTRENYEEMIFFDDDMRNIRDVSRLGVRCYFVEHGLSRHHIEPLINIAKR